MHRHNDAPWWLEHLLQFVAGAIFVLLMALARAEGWPLFLVAPAFGLLGFAVFAYLLRVPAGVRATLAILAFNVALGICLFALL